MEILESKIQHGGEMLTLEASRETNESQVFQTNCLSEYVFTGFGECEGEKILEAFRKEKKEDLSHEEKGKKNESHGP
jgi:hypothetical protein